MLGCIAEIAMLVFGIIFLVRGKINLSRDKVVEGAMARLIGVILILPLPLAFLVGVMIGISKGMEAAKRGGQVQLDPDTQMAIAITELAIIFGCLILALILMFATARPPQPKYGFDEEYDDEYPRRRRRAADDSGEEEESPRRRADEASEEDYGEDEPRYGADSGDEGFRPRR
jgi:hypothetical protein